MDGSACPADGVRGVSFKTTGPEGELHAGGSLRVVIAFGGIVPSFFSFLHTDDLAVDGPGDGLRLPVNLVVVPFGEGVAAFDARVAAVGVCCGEEG